VLKMHAGEVSTDAALVRRLLAAQYPEWAELAIERVPSSGTDNTLYRLGGDMVVRLPRIDWAVDGAAREQEWLPRLAPHLPVEAPVLLGTGKPAEGYPWGWAIYRWLEGVNPGVGDIADHDLLASDLAELVLAFRRIDLAGPSTGRGVPLSARDHSTRVALAELEGTIDTKGPASAWERALLVPAWSGSPVWIHGDLLPGNLLLRGGRLTGVIDFGCVGVGDPACDLIPAWGVLPVAARDGFRAELGVDDATWERGRGWALSIGLIALPYYVDTNPGFAAVARHLIREVLADL
jgi:aminoglycoside phosphotransferase (APT) family kinase protein